MKIHRTAVFQLMILAAVMASAAPARAVLLSDLMTPGQTVQVGDLLFSNFSYLQTNDMPNATGINVTPFTSLSGNNGLMFQGAFQDFFGPGGSDALIGYQVADISVGAAISSAALAGIPTVIDGTGVMSVTQSFLPTDASDILNIYSVAPGSTQTNSSVVFSSPLPSLTVQDSVLAYAVTGTPGLSFFTSTFATTSVPIPEPSTVTLLGIGLAVIGWRRWRRK
ncbi:MAG TPA: PEP-CTERM sorting domain-containing protein [Pirellulales bacterium]